MIPKPFMARSIRHEGLGSHELQVTENTRAFSFKGPRVTTRALHLVISALLAMALICAVPAAADIYRYIDANGVMHFTNTPMSTKYRLYMREPKPSAAVANARRFDDLIGEAARFHGLNPALIKAVIKAESDFNPKAVSKKGAMGLMQIMPENFELLKVSDPFNPRQNIMGGSRYLKEMLTRFGRNLQLALAAYNAGPSAVEQYKAIPPFPETRRYIQKVMRFYSAFRKG